MTFLPFSSLKERKCFVAIIKQKPPAVFHNNALWQLNPARWHFGGGIKKSGTNTQHLFLLNAPILSNPAAVTAVWPTDGDSSAPSLIFTYDFWTPEEALLPMTSNDHVIYIHTMIWWWVKGNQTWIKTTKPHLITCIGLIIYIIYTTIQTFGGFLKEINSWNQQGCIKLIKCI